jgi:hypothetical protein
VKGIPADPAQAEARRERARAELARWKRPIDSLEAWDAFERLTGIAEGTE